MSSFDTIRTRHSVREYTGKPIEGDTLAALLREIDECRALSGLDIQLAQGNPEAFDVVAKFGLIHGCSTYVAFVGNGANDEFDQQVGYWGQRIVLAAQELGLNTCWVGIFSKRKCKLEKQPDQKVRIIIAVGYGVTAGHERTTKQIDELSTVESASVPAWFTSAMEAAQLAPTAMNAQRFMVTLRSDARTVALSAAHGGFKQIDLGIVKHNFEVAANELGADWRWE